MGMAEQRASMVWGMVVGLLVTAGCRDQAKCDDAVGKTRQAVQLENTESARQWRDYAWKACGGEGDARALDAEILAKETAVAKRVEEEAKQAKDLAQKHIADAQAAYKEFDELEKKEQTAKALRKVFKDVNRLRGGLLPDYAKQIEDYNTAAFEKREEKLKDL